MCKEILVVVIYHSLIVPWRHEYVIVDPTFCCDWTVFPTTNLASYEALPVSPLVCIFLCSSLPLSFACLATLRVDFFKRLRIQLLNVRY